MNPREFAGLLLTAALLLVAPALAQYTPGAGINVTVYDSPT